MRETVTLSVNGVSVDMPAGSMVSAAILKTGTSTFRRSVSGEPRGPLCGMGICFECRVTIDGEPHCRSCQTVCRDGMDVRTDG
jgi:predicted molibdopterin-dependent oxidoreductase YjgC